MVVAETRSTRRSAAEAVMVDYEPLAMGGGHGRGRRARMRLDFGTRCPTTSWSTRTFGDAPAPTPPSPRAAHVVSMTSHVGRVTGVPLEPRAALGGYDPKTERYTLYAGSGGAVRQKHELAKVLGVEPDSRTGPLVRCRRQFRHPQSRLCRIRPGDVGVEEARPPGQVPRRSLGVLPDRLSGPRSRLRGVARARCRRQVPGAAGRQPQQCRRALRVAVAAEQGFGADHRFLRYPGGDAAIARDLLEHHADPGLSQLGPARSDVRDRAADRQGGARAWLRPARPAAPKPGAARADAVPQRGRLALRQRRI